MFVEDLNGHRHEWKPKGREVNLDKRSRSSLHIEARHLLKDKFPTLLLLEEIPFKPRYRDKKTLYFDFYIPLRRIFVEVNGEQHYKLSSQYHSTASEFLKQKKNDAEKEEWCELNGFQLIIFKFDEKDDWGSII